VLDPARAARLVSQSAYDATLPSFGDVVDRLIAAVLDDRPASANAAEVNRAVGRAFAERLMTLAGDAPMPQVRAIATSRLRRIAARLKAAPATTPDAPAAYGQLLQADIARFLTRPYPQARPATPVTVPPGAPIGSIWSATDEEWCGLRPGRDRAPFFAPLVH
jgi:hypothetical protein